MPYSCPKPCAHPGCRTLVVGRPRCDVHKAVVGKLYDTTTRRNDPHLAEAQRIRSSAQWQQLRNLYKARNPVCCAPFGNFHDAPADHVHHIIPLIEQPSLAFDWYNLASLCTACHSSIESLERSGQSTKEMFKNISIVQHPGIY